MYTFGLCSVIGNWNRLILDLKWSNPKDGFNFDTDARAVVIVVVSC